MVLLGAHVSVAGGLRNGPANGGEIGCRAIQIYSKNQRQWQARPLDREMVDAFGKARQEHGIEAVLVHDSYLINLASPRPEMLTRSRNAMTDEIRRADTLGTHGLVLHPGAHQEGGMEQGIATIAASLDHCVDMAGGSVPVLLENTAGQGTSVGARFEQLAAIIEAVAPATRKRLGVCFDTCHAHGAGYDLGSEASYNRVFDEFDRTIGLDRLRAFHLNDSKKPLGSLRDRHDGIGLGLMGLEPFRLLVNDARFADLPAILEVPGENRAYVRDLGVLRGLRVRPRV